ncbi:hypothetical protein [Streptomyces werraensis]|uniref:hypothetical protein n=1 Tax=Streptomyces werraensis TaxID=68284 RepID=UPI00343FB655
MKRAVSSLCSALLAGAGFAVVPVVTATPAHATVADCLNRLNSYGYNKYLGQYTQACYQGAKGASADIELCVGMLMNAAVRSGVAREACLVAPVP